MLYREDKTVVFTTDRVTVAPEERTAGRRGLYDSRSDALGAGGQRLLTYERLCRRTEYSSA